MYYENNSMVREMKNSGKYSQYTCMTRAELIVRVTKEGRVERACETWEKNSASRGNIKP